MSQQSWWPVAVMVLAGVLLVIGAAMEDHVLPAVFGGFFLGAAFVMVLVNLALADAPPRSGVGCGVQDGSRQ